MAPLKCVQDANKLIVCRAVRRRTFADIRRHIGGWHWHTRLTGAPLALPVPSTMLNLHSGSRIASDQAASGPSRPGCVSLRHRRPPGIDEQVV